MKFKLRYLIPEKIRYNLARANGKREHWAGRALGLCIIITIILQYLKPAWTLKGLYVIFNVINI